MLALKSFCTRIQQVAGIKFINVISIGVIMKTRYVVLIIILAIFFSPYLFYALEEIMYSKDINNYPEVCEEGAVIKAGESCILQTDEPDFVNLRCPWRYVLFWHPAYLIERLGGLLRAKSFDYDIDAFSIEEGTYTNFCKKVPYDKLVAKKTGSYAITYVYPNNTSRTIEIRVQ
jgi:hypothetical protein